MFYSALTAIKAVRARNYDELPILAIDSCYTVGRLPHIENYINRKTGISMSGIAKNSYYGLGWWALFLDS